MKKSIAWLMALILSLALSTAFAAGERVYDQAGLFTQGEVRALNEQIASFQEETGMDFLVLTSDETHDDDGHIRLAEDFFINGSFGTGDEASGALYYINMDDRFHYLITHGEMIDYMNDDRIAEATDASASSLGNGNCAYAASRMIDRVLSDFQAGIPEGQYRYDIITGEQLTARHKALTSGEVVGSAIVGLLICLIFVMIVQARYKLKGSTYAYNYRDNATVQMTGSEDTYLRTTTTQSRKPDPPQNSGSSGGGGSGSGVHTGSNGSSFGGGGGRF